MWIGGANDCGLVHALTEIVLEVTRIGAISRIDIEITGKLEATLRFKGSLPAEITLNLSTQVVPADQNFDAPLFSIAIANALCVECDVDWNHQNLRSKATYSRGMITSPICPSAVESSDQLIIRLRFDDEIFAPPTQLYFLTMCARTQELAIFNPQTVFNVVSRVENLSRQYHYVDGFKSYLPEMAYHYFDSSKSIIHLKLQEGDASAECVIYPLHCSIVRSFANQRQTLKHGSHVAGFKRAYRKVAKEFRDGDFVRMWPGQRDVLEGMALLIAVQLPDPRFGGATRDQLLDQKAEQLVYRMVKEKLPEELRKISDRQANPR